MSPLSPSAANENVNALLAFGVVALVLIAVTRGRLGYPGENVRPPVAPQAQPVPCARVEGE